VGDDGGAARVQPRVRVGVVEVPVRVDHVRDRRATDGGYDGGGDLRPDDAAVDQQDAVATRHGRRVATRPV